MSILTKLRLLLNQLPILWSAPNYGALMAFDEGQPVWPLVRLARLTGLLVFASGLMVTPRHWLWRHQTKARLEGAVLRACIRLGVLDISGVPEGGYYRWGRWTLNVRATRRRMDERAHAIALADVRRARYDAEFRRDREQQSVRTRLEASL